MVEQRQAEKSIFLAAVEIVSDQERAAYLEQACAGNPQLRAEVDALLLAHAKPQPLLDAAPPPAPTIDQPISEQPGTVIGPYKLLEQIGEGGFGVVFLAEQTEPVRRKVALKVLKPGMDTRQVVARFEAERQALALMDHPNIAQVHDGGTTPDGRPYFVMELVKGIPITEYCDQCSLTTRHRLDLFLSVCQAVQHAHQKGVIHRDLKPSNVLVAIQDGQPTVKVIDFGVAKAINQKLSEQTLVTGFHQMVGTPLYMSPEQAEMSPLDVDTRADIYALGVLLYELLTGTTPFEKERLSQASYDELRRIIREEEPPRPSAQLSTLQDKLTTVAAQRRTEPRQLLRTVKGELDWIVMKALEKDRNRRYETANGFAMDVQRYLADEPVQACPPSAWYRLRKFVRRNRRGLSGAAVVGLALLVAVGSIGWAVRDRAARRAEAEREQSLRQAKTAAQIDLILNEVDRLMGAQKWPAALAAAKRAEAALATGEADEATRRRVHGVLCNLEFVVRLERIRSDSSVVIDGKFDFRRASEAYAQAFLEYGLDRDQGPIAAGVVRLQGRPAVAAAVAAALDDWVEVHRSLGKPPSAWQDLVAISRQLDPDPLRNELRALWGQPVTPEVQATLRQLVSSIQAGEQSPATLLALAHTLDRAKLPDLAVQILQKGQQAHPDDFWLNLSLGTWLFGQKDPHAAARYCTAAVAIRPDSAAGHGNLGDALLALKKNDEAIIAYHKASKLDPRGVNPPFRLAFMLKELGRHNEAVAAFERVLDLDPKHVKALCNLSLIRIDQRKYGEAVDYAQKAIAADPNFALAHDILGIALREQKKLNEAIASHQKAIALDPTEAAAHTHLGVALELQGKLEEAIACHKKAIELDPNLTAAYGNLGLAYDSAGKPGEAVAAFQKALSLDAKSAAAHDGLGNALRALGQHEQAMAAFREAIRLDPENASPHNNLGCLFLAQNKLDEAIGEFREAIRLQPDFVHAHDNLGFALFKKGRLDEAVSSYRNALALDPTLVNTRINLGNVLSRQNKVEEAIACYKQAIALDPQSAIAHANLGKALEEQGKLDEAIALYHKAIALDPQYAGAHRFLARALLDQRKLDDAVAYYQKAVTLLPKDPRGHYGLGWALAAQGKYTEAAECYLKALELEPSDANAHDGLVCALAQSGDPRRAVELGNKAVALRPKSTMAWQGLGWAQYRAGDFQASITSLEKSCKLQDNGEGDCGQWIVLALAHGQLAKQDGLPEEERARHRTEAQRWYDNATKQIDRWRGEPNDGVGKAIWAFRAEAAKLLDDKE
jgi:tetratricopeptide (TPR) repeat protein